MLKRVEAWKTKRAKRRSRRRRYTVAAVVAVGASIAVVAWDRIGGVHTAVRRGAAISSAQVVIVTVEGLAVLAGAVSAEFVESAGVGIVTGKGVGCK